MKWLKINADVTPSQVFDELTADMIEGIIKYHERWYKKEEPIKMETVDKYILGYMGDIKSAVVEGLKKKGIKIEGGLNMNWNKREAQEKTVYSKIIDIFGREAKVIAFYYPDELKDMTRIHARIDCRIDTPKEQYASQTIVLYTIPVIIITKDTEVRKNYFEKGYKVFETIEQAEKYITDFAEGLE